MKRDKRGRFLSRSESETPGWQNDYGFTSRVVKLSEHDPENGLFVGEENVACPKCGSMRITNGSFQVGLDVLKNGLVCNDCGFVGMKKGRARKGRQRFILKVMA